MNAPPRPSGAVLVSSRLAAIRGVLEETLNSETADRQAALERIEQITTASRTESGIEPGGSASLLSADVATALHALAVAADASRHRAAMCAYCGFYPARRCARCEELLARADGYDALTVKLGGER